MNDSRVVVESLFYDTSKEHQGDSGQYRLPSGSSLAANSLVEDSACVASIYTATSRNTHDLQEVELSAYPSADNDRCVELRCHIPNGNHGEHKLFFPGDIIRVKILPLPVMRTSAFPDPIGQLNSSLTKDAVGIVIVVACRNAGLCARSLVLERDSELGFFDISESIELRYSKAAHGANHLEGRQIHSLTAQLVQTESLVGVSVPPHVLIATSSVGTGTLNAQSSHDVDAFVCYLPDHKHAGFQFSLGGPTIGTHSIISKDSGFVQGMVFSDKLSADRKTTLAILTPTQLKVFELPTISSWTCDDFDRCDSSTLLLSGVHKSHRLGCSRLVIPVNPPTPMGSGTQDCFAVLCQPRDDDEDYVSRLCTENQQSSGSTPRIIVPPKRWTQKNTQVALQRARLELQRSPSSQFEDSFSGMSIPSIVSRDGDALDASIWSDCYSEEQSLAGLSFIQGDSPSLNHSLCRSISTSSQFDDFTNVRAQRANTIDPDKLAHIVMVFIDFNANRENGPAMSSFVVPLPPSLSSIDTVSMSWARSQTTNGSSFSFENVMSSPSQTKYQTPRSRIQPLSGQAPTTLLVAATSTTSSRLHLVALACQDDGNVSPEFEGAFDLNSAFVEKLRTETKHNYSVRSIGVRVAPQRLDDGRVSPRRRQVRVSLLLASESETVHKTSTSYQQDEDAGSNIAMATLLLPMASSLRPPLQTIGRPRTGRPSLSRGVSFQESAGTKMDDLMAFLHQFESRVMQRMDDIDRKLDDNTARIEQMEKTLQTCFTITH